MSLHGDCLERSRVVANDRLTEFRHPHFEQHLLIIPQLHARELTVSATILTDGTKQPALRTWINRLSLSVGLRPCQLLILADFCSVRSLRAFSRTLISDPDLEGFHSFPSIYHLHLHVTKGRPTFPGAKEKFLPAKTVEDCFLRPFPIEDYLCHFATFDLVERVLTQDKDLKQLQGLTARRSRLHPIDRLLPAYAHLFEVADEKETDFTKVVELFDGGK